MNIIKQVVDSSALEGIKVTKKDLLKCPVCKKKFIVVEKTEYNAIYKSGCECLGKNIRFSVG